MHFKSLLFFCWLLSNAPLMAQNLAEGDICQKALLEAEKKRDTQIYTQCGFDDAHRALINWSSWAQRNKSYQAMYELCVRYPNTSDGVKLCQMAAIGGNGPALIYLADNMYAQKKYREAFESYTQALKSPMLTQDEKGHIAEKIGVLYLDPNSTYHNDSKGWPLIEKAATQRGALANNIIGVYAMLGLSGQKVDMKKSFEHLWRSALLGCKNAEENLGLFYLVYQNKVKSQDAQKWMQEKIYSCQSSSFEPNQREYTNLTHHDCNCVDVARKEKLASQYPYRLIALNPSGAVMQDAEGRHFSVMQDTVLPNGARITEIHKTAVVLKEGKTRHVIGLAPDENCRQYCAVQQTTSQNAKDPVSQIKPYHFTFTPSECSDILYYAEQLVDTKLPFTGKQECGFSDDLDEATQILMKE